MLNDKLSFATNLSYHQILRKVHSVSIQMIKTNTQNEGFLKSEDKPREYFLENQYPISGIL